MFIKQEVDFDTAKEQIEKGNVVFTEDRDDRATGKTTAIIAYSMWTGIPIVTGNRLMVNFYKGYNPNVKVILFNEIFEYRQGSRFLVDECLTLEQFNSLKKLHVVSGFMNVSGGL